MKIKSLFFILATFFFNPESFSKDTVKVFTCESTEQRWRAKVEFDEMNSPTVSISEKNILSVCRFEFENLKISPNAEVPNFQAVMKSVSCNLPAELKNEILSKLYLRVTKISGKYSGQLQWLQHSQSGLCRVTQYDSDGMLRLQTRWREGNLN